MRQQDFITDGISLKAARVNAGFTQKEAAKRLKISETTLLKYERGETYPTVPVIKRIEALYDIPYRKIIFSGP